MIFIKKTFYSVCQCVSPIKDKQTALETVKFYIDLHGKESVCLRFYEYWLKEKEKGRIYRI